jgi:chaperonin GroEL
MAKLIRYGEQARLSLARGVDQLAKAIQSTLGPRGGNAVIDRPIGTPLISRDGVSIADEIELEDRFENMGAQIVREVAKKTNEVAGDGTTTAIILANSLIQEGLAAFDGSTNTVAILDGIDKAVDSVVEQLRVLAKRVTTRAERLAVATVSAGDKALGEIVAEALERVGSDGIVEVEAGSAIKSEVEIVDGFSFDRGYLSGHMANQIDRMESVLDSALVLLTDHPLIQAEQVNLVRNIALKAKKPILIIAEQVSAEMIASLLAARDQDEWIVAVHPPEFGHWRKAVFEDIAVLTGARFISKDVGSRFEDIQLKDLGTAKQIQVSLEATTITGGGGDLAKISGRRTQIQKQLEAMEQPVERDKLAERLGRMSGAIAIIRAGGATPVEQKRRMQMIEDSLNAVRAAIAEGVLAGGGTAFAHASVGLDSLVKNSSLDFANGAKIVQKALLEPLRCIARNSGTDPDKVSDRVVHSNYGIGFNARTGQFGDLLFDGVLDPFKVSSTSLRNAVSVAKLVLTTQTLIVDKFEIVSDPTDGPCRGGGAENFGMDYAMQEQL